MYIDEEIYCQHEIFESVFISDISNCALNRENPLCNPVGFLPEEWSPLQATVHLCGLFCLPWHRHSGTRDHGFSLIRQTLFVITTLYVPWPGLNLHTDPSRMVSEWFATC
jgi:hypothetical protein